jgi:hypothetical protein
MLISEGTRLKTCLTYGKFRGLVCAVVVVYRLTRISRKRCLVTLVKMLINVGILVHRVGS